MRGRDTAIISEKAGRCNKNRLAYAGRFLVGDGGFTPSGHKLRLHLPTNKNTDRPDGQSVFLVGDGGFDPPKALPADLQSVPYGHSGNPPYKAYSIGAGGRIRTPDLLITNQLLYQLSYTSISPANRIITEVSRNVNKKVQR